VFGFFFNLISNGVTDPNSRTKFCYPTWPNVDIDNSDSYPIIIIESPEFRWKKFTFTKRDYIMTIKIHIFSTTMKQLDSLTSQVINTIRDAVKSIRGLRIDNIMLNGVTTDHVKRDTLTIHTKDIEFIFNIVFNHG